MKKLKKYQEEFFDEASRLRRQCDEKIDEKTIRRKKFVKKGSR